MESDGWRPAADIEVLQLRARLLRATRDYFAATGALEVETPALSAAGTTDPHLQSFRVVGTTKQSYLHTSPEFPMKRLLAAGVGPIYQICRVFRDGESGRLHNPEFTMVEWYRIGNDHWQLMEDTETLIHRLLSGYRQLRSSERLSYGEAFHRHVGIDPHHASADELFRCARTHHVAVTVTDEAAGDIDFWRDLLLTHLVEPHLGKDRLTFLYDYPTSQAALARLAQTPPFAAERFEVYLDGIELANGFNEATDATDLSHRFVTDQAYRQRTGLPDVPVDQHLLAAVAYGLPDCAGAALGFDRIVMLATGRSHLHEVLAFPWGRA